VLVLVVVLVREERVPRGVGIQRRVVIWSRFLNRWRITRGKKDGYETSHIVDSFRGATHYVTIELDTIKSGSPPGAGVGFKRWEEDRPTRTRTIGRLAPPSGSRTGERRLTSSGPGPFGGHGRPSGDGAQSLSPGGGSLLQSHPHLEIA
jgi:hypothetical protein